MPSYAKASEDTPSFYLIRRAKVLALRSSKGAKEWS